MPKTFEQLSQPRHLLVQLWAGGQNVPPTRRAQLRECVVSNQMAAHPVVKKKKAPARSKGDPTATRGRPWDELLQEAVHSREV